MNKLNWREEGISKQHDRKAFDCGNDKLNDFLHHHARKNHENNSAKTFLAIDTIDNNILGFYSLSPISVLYTSVPDNLKKGLGRYDVPAFLLGRLAVHKSMQGKGLGGQLLLAAGRRCLAVSSQVGGVAMVIDAKDERAAQWYASYGGGRLLDKPLTLMIPLKTIKAALECHL